MKRRAFKVVVLLLLGAIVNVAVAWGCAMWSWSFFGEQSETQISAWPRSVPSGFPLAAQWLSTDGKFGVRQIVASAVGQTRYLESEWLRTGVDGPFWIQSLNQCGLPFLSLEWTMHYPADESVIGGWQIGGLEPPTWMRDTFDLSRRLPYEALWPGFAINTIFYALILGAMWFAAGYMRRVKRVRRGQCPACAYPIGTSPICTECGAALDRRLLAGDRIQLQEKP